MNGSIPKYQQVARQLGDKLRLGVLAEGDKLPSVRMLSQELGVSINTVQQAYYCLEAEGLVEARPQSGYYARTLIDRMDTVPRRSEPQAMAHQTSLSNQESVLRRRMRQQREPGWLSLSMGVPAPELLPVSKLTKALQQAQRELPHGGIEYEQMVGNQALRRQIARYALFWGSQLTDEEIITTEGCTAALTLCLKTVTRPGDTVAVESPVYFGILQTILSLGLKVLELPTDPLTGVDLDVLEKHLQIGQVQACLLVPSFSNPLGCCMPITHKQRLVRLMESYQIPLIEDDLYGDLHFAPDRPLPCKAFDRQGLVLWCGSFSKTLAPGYRVGWVAPGRYYEALFQIKRYQGGFSPGLTQQAVANFLANDRYELHLRRLRQRLKSNCQRYQQTIRTYFPEGTRISEPQGGFTLWVEVDARIDTLALADELAEYKISILPGCVFSLQPQYGNCMRLSYGMPFDERVAWGLQTIGQLIHQQLGL
ncbi:MULTISPECIES: PLP-dependent aminotransferase family protein [unclassified Spirosoma]|uniref:aminotransferase-like domain-containing protein n=1 Tax=unclassified Spirosoma TaxID=2621999 RepID=UPI0009674192|nr:MULTISPECIES: PLP-dependent aminotransferase family protein [unclassified Spirosoma]MBN8820746.1 PLP-dependent aminotransferase family protein [Spirosoma sp.]OJW70717.1 MAG: GntR family transcriptional regulator [Spirosoma sp. 48-14]